MKRHWLPLFMVATMIAWAARMIDKTPRWHVDGDTDWLSWLTTFMLIVSLLSVFTLGMWIGHENAQETKP